MIIGGIVVLYLHRRRRRFFVQPFVHGIIRRFRRRRKRSFFIVVVVVVVVVVVIIIGIAIPVVFVPWRPRRLHDWRRRVRVKRRRVVVLIIIIIIITLVMMMMIILSMMITPHHKSVFFFFHFFSFSLVFFLVVSSLVKVVEIVLLLLLLLLFLLRLVEIVQPIVVVVVVVLISILHRRPLCFSSSSLSSSLSFDYDDDLREKSPCECSKSLQRRVLRAFRASRSCLSRPNSLRSQTEEFLLFIHDFDESKAPESIGHTKTSSSVVVSLSLSPTNPIHFAKGNRKVRKSLVRNTTTRYRAFKTLFKRRTQQKRQ